MREQRDRITRETASMTVAQRVAYFKKGASWYDDAKTGENSRRRMQRAAAQSLGAFALRHGATRPHPVLCS